MTWKKIWDKLKTWFWFKSGNDEPFNPYAPNVFVPLQPDVFALWDEQLRGEALIYTAKEPIIIHYKLKGRSKSVRISEKVSVFNNINDMLLTAIRFFIGDHIQLIDMAPYFRRKRVSEDVSEFYVDTYLVLTVKYHYTKAGQLSEVEVTQQTYDKKNTRRIL